MYFIDDFGKEIKIKTKAAFKPIKKTYKSQQVAAVNIKQHWVMLLKKNKKFNGDLNYKTKNFLPFVRSSGKEGTNNTNKCPNAGNNYWWYPSLNHFAVF